MKKTKRPARTAQAAPETEERQIRKIKNAGFSLVEVILSIAILAIITVPLLNYFWDSSRRNMMMEQKQRATLMAQEVTEDLKSETKPLIRKPDGGGGYTAPYLIAEGYTEKSSTVGSSGTGKVCLTKTIDNFDVEVTLETAIPEDDIARPLIAGIDNDTDVVALENREVEDAKMYFITESLKPDESGNVPASPLTTAEVMADMTRKILITVGVDADGKYTVEVTESYSCRSYTPYEPSIVDTRLDELKNIYLFYDKISKTKADTIEITYDASVPPSCAPKLYLVCQGQSKYESDGVTLNTSDTGPDSGYSVTVNAYGLSTLQTVCTNISNNNVNNLTGSISNASVGVQIPTEGLTADGKKAVGQVKITTVIYEKGHADTDASLAVMETVKGE